MGIFGKDSDGYKIFSTNTICDSKNVIQKVRYNREHIMSDKTAEELNTYLNFGVFPTFAETYADEFSDKGPKYERVMDLTDFKRGAGTPGVRSIFNRAGAVMIGAENVDGYSIYDIDVAKDTHWWRINNNVPLMDSPGARRAIRKMLGCSVKELVNASQQGLMGQATYAYSDFMYCKHLGRVPNNYMITLRRFSVPVSDFIGTTGMDNYDYTPIEPWSADSIAASEKQNTRISRSSKHPSSIGCMVTWLGVSGNEMSNILKYSFKMPFKETQSEMQDSKQDADANNSVIGGMFNMFDATYRKQYMAGQAGNSANAAFKHFGINLGDPPYGDHLKFKDRNKVYGPIDAIRSTYIRSDEGLTYSHKMTLVFEYELRSYNGINPRQAMLDLISNILNVTYTTGSFWGGGIRGYGAHQSNIWSNLNIYKCRGGFTDFIDAFALDLSNVGQQIKGSLGINWDDPKSIFSGIKGLMNTIGGMLMGGMLNKMGRPQKAMYNSFLSPSPIGFWHVTIGNPKAPIMSMGNMVITNVTLEHTGVLGLDNFPTGLKVTVELDRGKPRDLRDIERLYMHGNDRIYSSMSDKIIDMYKNASDYREARKKRTMALYQPGAKTSVSKNNAIGNKEATDASKSSTSKPDEFPPYKPTITPKVLAGLKLTLLKNFGTADEFAIIHPAAEQEYGAGKKSEAEAYQSIAAGS